MNHKKIQRLWREEGLRRPPPRRNTRRRPGNSEGILVRTEYPNHVWALDFPFDKTAGQRRLQLLNIVDEHTREALAMDVHRCIGADQVVSCLERLVAQRGAPARLRMDNGPELVAWVLRDWWRLSGLGTVYIEPGSPWENPWIESFNGRARDELLNTEESGSLTKPESSSKTGGSRTTPGVPTAASPVSPLPDTLPPGPPQPPNHSHNGWTNNRGPVTGNRAMPIAHYAEHIRLGTAPVRDVHDDVAQRGELTEERAGENVLVEEVPRAVQVDDGRAGALDARRRLPNVREELAIGAGNRPERHVARPVRLRHPGQAHRPAMLKHPALSVGTDPLLPVRPERPLVAIVGSGDTRDVVGPEARRRADR